MKQIIVFLSLMVVGQVLAQDTFLKYEDALTSATIEEKPIMLIFSGSDWCKPCIQLKKDILDTSVFQEVEKELLVMYLDFPYKKKNHLSTEETKQNESLAEKYNTSGHFPKVVLINGNGSIIGELPYDKGMSKESFIANLQKII